MPGMYRPSNPDRFKEKDFYPTPAWATQALVDRERFDGDIWEPACGEMHMVDVLRKAGYPVIATDLKTGHDFLASPAMPRVANVVTNPPFCLANEFVLQAKALAEKKVAMFLRLCFLEGMKRHKMFQDREFPLKRVYVFSKRVTFELGKVGDKNGGQLAFAWFVWDRAHTGSPEIAWIGPESCA